jgi:hypothetical protein
MKLVGLEDRLCGAWDLRQVHRETAEGHRFLVGVPGHLAFGHAFQKLAGGRHLLIELCERQFFERHVVKRPRKAARKSKGVVRADSIAPAGVAGAPTTIRCMCARTPASRNRDNWSIE